LLLLQTADGNQGVDRRPLSEVPVNVVLKGPEGLQLVGHLLLHGAGDHPEVFERWKANGFIG